MLFHTNASSRSFFEGGVFLTEAFEFGFQSFVEHGLVPRCLASRITFCAPYVGVSFVFDAFELTTPWPCDCLPEGDRFFLASSVEGAWPRSVMNSLVSCTSRGSDNTS